LNYLEDASGFTGFADRVVVARDEGEVLKCIASCVAGGVPLTILGGGTGVTGGGVAQGGWVISLEKLTKLEIAEGCATVGAGLRLRDLKMPGQFYAPDPTETLAAMGGTIATNASGSRSFLYGATRRHIERLRVALMDGRILDVRRGDQVDFEVSELPAPRTTKHTAGYFLRPGMDWVDLFIGSEGTLGIVLEAEVKLLPSPAELVTAVVFFPSDGAALDAVDLWRGIPGLRMLEYLDGPSLDLLKSYGVPSRAEAALLIELEGGEPDERLEQTDALYDGSWFGSGPADRERFRVFRHALPERVNDIVRRNGSLKMGTDFAVPIERNREMMAIYRRGCEEHFRGRYVIFGHIGDAHLHVNLLPASAEEQDRARDLILEFARAAVALGGTVSAEHGLGKRKAHLLELQFTPEQIELMKAVKRRLDPRWLLGQGTMFTRATTPDLRA
jgi:FAD/FMN-containing dehydrogenase